MNLFKTQVPCLLFLFGFLGAYQAQDLNYIWHHNHDFDGYGSIANDVVANAQGEIYVLYSHSDPMDVDPTMAVIPTGGTLDYVTVVKYDDQREYMWHSTLTVNVWSANMEQDDDGNLYIFGFYASAFDADPGPGITQLIPLSSSTSSYMIKLDSEGQFIDARSIDAVYNVRLESMDFDTDGNSYLTGYFGGDLDADPGVGTYTHIDTLSGGIFVIKLNENMDHIWSFVINGPSADYGEDIIVNGSNFYLSGSFRDSADFDPSANTIMKSGPTTIATFVAKYDTSSSFIDAAIFDRGIEPEIALGPSDKLILAGSHMGTSFDADPSTSGTSIIPSTTWWEKPHLICLDTNFVFQWAGGFETSNTSPPTIKDVRVDGAGNILIAGQFGNTIDFDPGPGNFDITSIATSGSDIFLGMYDLNGQLVSAYGLLGLYQKSLGSLKLGPNNEVFLPLLYSGSMDIDLGPSTFNVKSASSIAALILEYSTCPTNVNSISPTICHGEAYSVGDTSYYVTGLHRYRTLTASGCDSIIEIDLTVTKPLVKIKNVTDTLQVEYSPTASYQWINCTTNTIVAGATDSVFAPTDNSPYSVIVNDFGCTDTSVCVQFLQGAIAGVPELTWAAAIEETRWGEHNNLITDKYGNLYVCGQFGARTDVSLFGDSVFFQEAGTSQDILLLKYDNDGNLIWGYPVGTAGSSNVNEYATSIAVDDDGNVYLAGNYIQEMDFDPSQDIELYIDNMPPLSCCTNTGFIAKLNQSGQIQWVKGIGGNSILDIKSLAISPSGMIAITGRITGTPDMDPGPGIQTISGGGYFATYDSNGNLAIAVGLPGTSPTDHAYGHSVSYDSKNRLVVSGTSGDDFDFDLGAGDSTILVGGDDKFIFLAQYNENMELDWVKRVGAINSSIFPRTVVEHDCMDNLYFGGQEISSLNFSGNSGSIAGLGIFAVRYDSTGFYNLSYPISSSSQFSSDHIAMDIDMYGNLFVTGKATGGNYFGTSNILAGSSEQTFVAKYNPEGTNSWVFGIEDYNGQNQVGIATDQNGNVFLASKGVPNAFDVDPSANTYNLNTFYSYLAKYGEGCSPVDTSATVQADSIIVSSNNYYVWHRCSDDVAVDSTFNSNFVAPTTDNYYAVVHAGECSDTTDCFYVFVNGIDEESQITWKLYPNPTSGTVSIESSSSEKTSLQLFSMPGKRIDEFEFQQKTVIDMNKYPTGIYFFKDSHGAMLKVIKVE